MKKQTLILSLSASLIAFHAQAEGWTYDNTGDWGSLKEDYALCKTGKTQSPIDLRADLTVGDLPDLNLAYGTTPLTVLNNGHAIQVNVEGDYSFNAGDERYKLLQFHFHTPSEYTIEGKRYPLEMHLVHKNDQGELGVIGVMLEEGDANPQIQKIWDNASKEEGTKTGEGQIDITALLPRNLEYFRYMGSLTTPPCSEGVNWFTLKTPVSVSKDQIEAFKAIFKNNARPLQETNHRLIVSE